MRKKVLILGLCLLGVKHSLSSKDKKSIPLYKDAKAPIEKRIEDLISRMTLEEKVLQLNQYTLGRNNNVNNVGEELKHFEKQLIKVGEMKTFRFDIDLERDFSFVNEDGKRFLEAGEYHILVQGQTVKIELID